MIKDLISNEAYAEILAGEIRGIHGMEHWVKVSQLGSLLAMQSGGNPTVAFLFGLYHDCRRLNDGRDPEHGSRAADLMYKHYKEGSLRIEEDEASDLIYACKRHSDGLTTDDPTVGACWDADRLDLIRVGIEADINLMSTEAGRHMASLQKGVSLYG